MWVPLTCIMSVTSGDTNVGATHLYYVCDEVTSGDTDVGVNTNWPVFLCSLLEYVDTVILSVAVRRHELQVIVYGRPLPSQLPNGMLLPE